MRTVRPGVQHRAAVTQTCHALAVQQMGINTCNLGCRISAQTHHAARDLVHQLEGLEIERFTRASQQGFKVLKQWRHDQLVAIATRRVQQLATEFFDVPCLGRQDIGYVIRKDPGRHVFWGRC